MFKGFLAFICEMDSACVNSMRNRRYARSCAQRAATLAIQAKRPDLAYQANALLAAL